MRTNKNQIITVSGFKLPPSDFLNDETRQTLQENGEESKRYWKGVAGLCLPLAEVPAEDIPANRQRQAELYYESPMYKRLRKDYDVDIKAQTLGGVYTEIFTPRVGVAEQHKHQVLINLHGGSFTAGGRFVSHIESIPIAALGAITVISVDYRMAPEHQFPAATEDVVAVYKALLQDYPPENIGIYGSSAGATITAQCIARFLHVGLPLPGAVGLLAGGAYYWLQGDSGIIGVALASIEMPTLQSYQYFSAINEDNLEAFPGGSPEVMQKFPPTLLATSTRDPALSGVVQTHNELVRQGVEAQLHIWDGLGHTFHYDADLLESRNLYAVLINFFKKQLSSESLNR